MIGLIILSALSTLCGTGGSCVYTLAPIIVILLFILAAAGLTRGVSIFNLFGLGALLGIGGGVGKGGVGKGLKAGSAVGRRKMSATIKKAPTGLKTLAKNLGVRNKTKRLQKQQINALGKLGKYRKKQFDAKNAGKPLTTRYYGWRAIRTLKKVNKYENKITKLTGGKINMAVMLAANKNRKNQKYINAGYDEFKAMRSSVLSAKEAELSNLEKTITLKKPEVTLFNIRKYNAKINLQYYYNLVSPRVAKYGRLEKELEAAQGSTKKNIKGRTSPENLPKLEGIIEGNVEKPSLKSRITDTLATAKFSNPKYLSSTSSGSGKTQNKYINYLEANAKSRLATATETGGILLAPVAAYYVYNMFRGSKGSKASGFENLNPNQQSQQGGQNSTNPPPPISDSNSQQSQQGGQNQNNAPSFKILFVSFYKNSNFTIFK
ncbi:MAG: hypothetical protein ACP5UN_00780 [Candidatus Micrarchaeia archaeon]